RSAAEHRDRDPGGMGNPQHGHQLAAAARLDQPVRRAADAKRRQRRQRRAGAQAIGAELRADRLLEGAHTWPASTAISVRSCAINAAIASRMVQTTNEIVSPGPSWPASAMSAATTVAILG